MKSEYETSAARQAVDAVERRWQQAHGLEIRQKRIAAIRGWLAGLTLIALAGAGGLFVADRYFGVKVMDLPASLSGVGRIISDVAGCAGVQDVESEYVRVLRQFERCEPRPYADLANDAKPRNAVAGTVYHAYAQTAKGSGLFSFVADGKGGFSVKRLSPIEAPRSISVADFKSACDGKPFLILVGGSSYVCGAKSPRDGDSLRQSIRDL